jgi:hypothetical protein
LRDKSQKQSFSNREDYSMQFRVNEKKLMELCIKAHGESLGETVFTIELAKQNKRIAEYHELERERDSAQKALDELQATQSLAHLERAMKEANTTWLAACNALEEQRVKNVEACQPFEQKLGDLSARIATFHDPSRGEWAPLSARDKAGQDARAPKFSWSEESKHKMEQNPRTSWGPANPSIAQTVPSRNWVTNWPE